MGLTSEQKVVVVQLIGDNKDVLFGSIKGTKVSNETKANAWQSIVNICRNTYGFSAVPVDKDWSYLRDTTWSNWKLNTLAKRDAKEKTGSGGGKTAEYTPVSNY
jgi:hypothetical protein